jgi:hypothetical protein
MVCSSTRDKLGAYVDGELAAGEAEAVRAHLRACPACATELARLKMLLGQLAAADVPADRVQPPADLWARIEGRLARSTGQRALTRYWRRPLTAAASLAVLLGLTTLTAVWVNQSAQPAAAAVVDYSLLLDGVAADVDGAVERFFQHYHAAALDAGTVAAVVPRLSFSLPDELPGGFKREGVYRLRFGKVDGVAARYRRGNEPLVVFFHPPLDKTQMGVHRQSCCHVAGREGQRVEVGPWQLVHFTDPSTCHCLLSKLDEAGQSAVFAAVAPSFSQTQPRP